MAFATEERAALLARVRYELGYSAVSVSGEPYIGWTLAPDIAIDNLETGAETTSATDVLVESTPTTITLALATGFAAGLRIHVDVGVQREVVIAQSLSGTSLTARFAKAHTGTYPVEVESGESMLRTILTDLERMNVLLGTGISTSGIKQIDKGDVVFFGDGNSESRMDTLRTEQMRLRDDLAGLLKLPNLWSQRTNSNRLEAY